MESRATVGADNNLYLYCFFRGLPFLLPQKGIDGMNATLVLSYRDLCALVSPVPTDEYNERALEQRLQDLEWLTPRIKRHEEIVRYVMGGHPVIPIRFGTIYMGDERVSEILRKGHDELSSHLDFISDKEEWGVKVYAEEGAGRQSMEFSGELISQLDRKISSAASPGGTYLLKKKRENLIRQQSIQFLNSASDGIYQRMLSRSIEGRKNKVLGKRSTGKEIDMILNAVFLLRKLDVEVFIEKVDDLAASYERDDLSFEISGPWPCYNFCPDFEALMEP